jgi:RimJ/RimL family protein N-acetyltransferase
MEKVPYQEAGSEETVGSTIPLGEPSPEIASDWRHGLPTLAGSLVTLRDLRTSDARALFVMLATDEVTRFISPPPASIEGFEKFVAWTLRERLAGQCVCFAIVPRGSDTAIGLVQIRSMEPEFGTAEWGFAVASEFWGTGIFGDSARLAINFASGASRGARLAGQYARQRRAAKARGVPRSHPAEILPAPRRGSRSGALDTFR